MNLTSVTASQLEYFVAALDHPTWREAAAAVGVTPSALSQGLAELERRLGVVLFERDGRLRTPTDEAARVRFHGERVLAELHELARWSEEVRLGTTGRLAIGMIDTAAIHHFGDDLVDFRRDHPDLTLHLGVAPSNELLERLRAGDLDVAVVVDPDPSDDLDAIELIDEPLHVYAPPTALVGSPRTWGPWVGFPRSSRTRALIARALRGRDVHYDVVAESSQPAVLREMVRLGMGFCVLPITDAETDPHALRRAVDDPIATRTLTLVTRSARHATPALALLVDVLRARGHQHAR